MNNATWIIDKVTFFVPSECWIFCTDAMKDAEISFVSDVVRDGAVVSVALWQANFLLYLIKN